MCNCVEKANEAMVEHNCRVVTKTLINFNTGKSRESQPFVTLEKIEKSRKPLMTLLCNFCPFCGEKCMPVEPQPHCEQTTYDDGRPGILTLWGWKNRDDCLYVSKHKHDIEQCIREHCPFRHGDVVEFWPACDFRGCDNAGRYRFISPHLYRESDSVHCGNHALEGRDPVNPTFRTVTRVEVRQGDGWEWVVFLSEESNNAETT